MDHMTIRHILVPTDLSPTAAVSYRYALAFAKAFKAHVSLLYVDELAEVGFRSSDAMLTFLEQVGSVREERLAQAEAFFDSAGQTVSVVEVPGHAASEIERFTQENAVDLIVLTRHGDHGTGPLGSTSLRLVRNAATPVLVVHDPVSYEDEQGAPPAALERLLVSTDFSEDSTAGLAVAARLAAELGAEPKVVHVFRSIGSAIPTANDELPPTPQLVLDELQTQNEERFLAWLQVANAPEMAHAVVPGHSAAVGLVAAAIDWNASIIAIPTHGKGAMETLFVGSTSERLLCLSPIPVLVMPRPWLRKTA